MAGFGPIWFIFALPSIIYFTLRSLKNSDKVNLFLILISILMFLLHPSNWWTRYTIFITALGAVSIGYLMQHLSQFTKYIIQCALILLALYTGVTSIAYTNFAGYYYNGNKVPLEKRSIGTLYNPEYNFADNLAKNSVIAHSPMTFTYSLFSSNFKNKVYLIDAPTKEDWINLLLKGNYDVVAVSKAYGDYYNWIQSYTIEFSPISQSEDICAFKINR
jgi:hypothetical protein